ncbi:MAG: aminotransferase class V-fold PLP-dependent enzyme [Haliscomenobacter sp.]|nr:aminotransferase class V-fold PLP-dependent enzyme [Haliscomenobacter sp.]
MGWFSMDDLEALITPRTRIIALSHVQFTSGFAADLQAIGALCRERGIDFIVDAAQSLGSMPVYPEEWNISALASAGWKWLPGPNRRRGVLHLPSISRQAGPVQVGAETMTQGFDYLDHRWTPHTTAKRFEYSTSTITHVAALNTCLREVHNYYGIGPIFGEILRLQDVFLAHLNHPEIKPLIFEAPYRSGILSWPARIRAKKAISWQRKVSPSPPGEVFCGWRRIFTIRRRRWSRQLMPSTNWRSKH